MVYDAFQIWEKASAQNNKINMGKDMVNLKKRLQMSSFSGFLLAQVYLMFYNPKTIFFVTWVKFCWQSTDSCCSIIPTHLLIKILREKL
jgi:hypothetical protein